MNRQLSKTYMQLYMSWCAVGTLNQNQFKRITRAMLTRASSAQADTLQHALANCCTPHGVVAYVELKQGFLGEYVNVVYKQGGVA